MSVDVVVAGVVDLVVSATGVVVAVLVVPSGLVVVVTVVVVLALVVVDVVVADKGSKSKLGFKATCNTTIKINETIFFIFYKN